MRNYWPEIKQKIEAATKGRLRSQFAEKAGVQPNTVKAWLEENRVPGIDKLGDIARALGVNAYELIAPPGTVPAAVEHTPQECAKRALEFLASSTAQFALSSKPPASQTIRVDEPQTQQTAQRGHADLDLSNVPRTLLVFLSTANSQTIGRICRQWDVELGKEQEKVEKDCG